MRVPTMKRKMKFTLEERFWAKVDRRGPDECWPWTAGLTHGHGQFVVMGEDGRGHPVGAHRMAWELLVGPIPESAVLDHLCHTRDTSCPGGSACLHRRCVNPAHLEPVTNEENVARGRWQTVLNRTATKCQRGHPFTEKNTYRTPSGRRQCRACARARRTR